MREVKINLSDAMPLIEERLSCGEEVLFSPSGTSMLPTIQPGVDTVVLVSPPKRLRKYDIAMYKRANGQYVLHRVVKCKDKYTFTGDNQFYNEENIEHRQIIALCKARIRNEKRMELDSGVLRLFARLHLFFRPLRRLLRKAASFLRRLFKNTK